MNRLIEEIGARTLAAVLGIYVLASWAILRLISTLESSLGLPGWVFLVALSLLSIGLPIMLSTAFVQRGSPADGEAEGSGRPRAAQDAAAMRHVFTWKNALVGGFGGFVALAMGTAAWLLADPALPAVDASAAEAAIVAPAGPASTAEETAADVVRGLGDAIRAMDVEATLAAYDDGPDFTYTFGSDVIEGREAFNAVVRAGFASLQAIDVWEIDDLDTTLLDENHVLVVARFHEEALDRTGTHASLRGVHTVVLVRRGAEWRIAFGHTAAEPIDG